jgi:hypothetical protein
VTPPLKGSGLPQGTKERLLTAVMSGHIAKRGEPIGTYVRPV